ncbi:uncharacterized protein LOC143080706 isoform X1 [Mytilus galloprovincialis]|uniref:uncharacterized protein LOC143080706 isoform X1 n=1 Tax=Mytilus galloprovincialis TaxID=29158 RepID=UPI003F7C785B
MNDLILIVLIIELLFIDVSSVEWSYKVKFYIVNFTLGGIMSCIPSKSDSNPLSHQIQNNVLTTLLVVIVFTAIKSYYDKIRREKARVAVFVIGTGPVGVTAALAAVQTKRVTQLVFYEQEERNQVYDRNYQICFDRRSTNILKKLHVDFDNIEGIWDDRCFYTRVGNYIEYIFSAIKRSNTETKIYFNKKFCRETLKDIESIQGRCLVITSDGRNGQAQRILGLNDFSEQYSCGAFGTVAAVERADLREIPTPEIRVHNLNFDLSAYGGSAPEANGTPGFSLKIFGNSKHRFISLAIAKCDLPVVKALRTILDRAMMRNIFLKCFNTYKLSSEPLLSESYALNHMKYSPRLFEIKLSQRSETVAYFDDCDMFVLAEGEAAAFLNFHTGLDINPAIRGLTSLGRFIEMITVADTEHAVSNALMYKMKHSEQLFRDFVKNGIREYMLT